MTSSYILVINETRLIGGHIYVRGKRRTSKQIFRSSKRKQGPLIICGSLRINKGRHFKITLGRYYRLYGLIITCKRKEFGRLSE